MTANSGGSSDMLNDRDQAVFVAYLRACTDAQVRGICTREKAARRLEYAHLAEAEWQRRVIAAS